MKRWLDETGGGTPVRLGLVEGSAMLYRDWQAVKRAASGTVIELDADVDAARTPRSTDELESQRRARAMLTVASERIGALARPGADLRAAVIEMERATYSAGAQDVRVRIARRPGGQPTTLPDGTLPMTGPTLIAMAVRYQGAWTEARFSLEAQQKTGVRPLT